MKIILTTHEETLETVFGSAGTITITGALSLTLPFPGDPKIERDVVLKFTDDETLEVSLSEYRGLDELKEMLVKGVA